MQTSQIEGLLTVEQVIDKLHISKVSLWNLGKRGILRPGRIGARNYYKERDVRNFIENPPINPSYLTAQEIKEKGTQKGTQQKYHW